MHRHVVARYVALGGAEHANRARQQPLEHLAQLPRVADAARAVLGHEVVVDEHHAAGDVEVAGVEVERELPHVEPLGHGRGDLRESAPIVRALHPSRIGRRGDRQARARRVGAGTEHGRAILGPHRDGTVDLDDAGAHGERPARVDACEKEGQCFGSPLRHHDDDTRRRIRGGQEVSVGVVNQRLELRDVVHEHFVDGPCVFAQRHAGELHARFGRRRRLRVRLRPQHEDGDGEPEGDPDQRLEPEFHVSFWKATPNMVYGRIWSARFGFAFALSFSMSFWRSTIACSLAVSSRASDAGISYTRTTLSCAGTVTLSLWCHTVTPAGSARDAGATWARA
jgi:hypothetical protein